VKEIREIIDKGGDGEAHEALDQLLALGPQNTEALKLRASLYEHEGRFAEEGRTWDRIAVIDREDPDAVSYLLRRQVEDREHFYFTDDVPGGGRRFMAYPRALVNNSAIGLVGCIAFLLSTRLTPAMPMLAEPAMMLGLFTLFVMVPWLAILVVYFRCIRSVTLSTHGITVATRIRKHAFRWGELEKVCMARAFGRKGPTLSLVLVPKDKATTTVEIDLNHGSTAIRARSYLVREITRLFSEPEYTRRDTLGLKSRRLSSY
jgi:hypothetical protein